MKKARLEAELERIVAEHPLNRQEDGKPYFGKPLVGYAAGNDPLFASYKELIGPFHRTPIEAFVEEFKEEPEACTVVSWSLPINKATRKDQRNERKVPSRRWARTRNYGQMFIDELSHLMLSFLKEHDVRAVSPFHSPTFKSWVDDRVGWCSNWSERHAAYAAGVGTFSLNDALITEHGIAHRLGSLVLEHEYKPSKRKENFRGNCIWGVDGGCGKCAKRCPVGAISKKRGHDKTKCHRYCYVTLLPMIAEEYDVKVSGCGLCQVDVPCEKSIPKGLGK